MKKPSKDEILDWFERFKSILTLGGIWNRRSEQIYRQIHQLIENQPEGGEEVIKVESSSLTHRYLPTDIYLIKKRRNDEIKKKN